MRFSKKAEKEIIELSKSKTLRRDMDRVSSQRHNPFIKDGRPDADAFVEFVTAYNEFINHAPKPFRKIKDRFMRL